MRSSGPVRLLPAVSDAVRYPFRSVAPLYVVVKVVTSALLIVTVALLAWGGLPWGVGTTPLRETMAVEAVSGLAANAIYLAFVPFLGYGISIAQASMRGSAEPPPGTAVRRQLRTIAEVGVIWVLVVFFSDLVLSLASGFLFGELGPFQVDLRPVVGARVYEGARPLIDRAILYYSFPMIVGIYARHERLADFFPLGRLKDVLLDRNYARIGLAAAAVWLAASYVANALLLRTVTAWILRQEPSASFLPVLVAVGFVAIALWALVWLVLPVFVIARLTGAYWHAIGAGRADGELLVDTSRQRRLDEFPSARRGDRPSPGTLVGRARARTGGPTAVLDAVASPGAAVGAFLRRGDRARREDGDDDGEA